MRSDNRRRKISKTGCLHAMSGRGRGRATRQPPPCRARAAEAPPSKQQHQRQRARERRGREPRSQATNKHDRPFACSCLCLALLLCRLSDFCSSRRSSRDTGVHGRQGGRRGRHARGCGGRRASWPPSRARAWSLSLRHCRRGRRAASRAWACWRQSPLRRSGKGGNAGRWRRERGSCAGRGEGGESVVKG